MLSSPYWYVHQQQQHVNDLSTDVPLSTMTHMPYSTSSMVEPSPAPTSLVEPSPTSTSLLTPILHPREVDAKTFTHDPYGQAAVFHQALANIVPAYSVAALIAEGRKYQAKHPCAPNTQTLFVGEMPLCWKNMQGLIDILCGIISVLGLDVTVSSAHLGEKYGHFNGCVHFAVSDLNVLLQHLNRSILAEPEYVFIAQTPEQKAILRNHAEKFEAACRAHQAQTNKKLRLPTPRNVMSFEEPKQHQYAPAESYYHAN